MKNTGERRTWNTPVRNPWNPIIKACLNAVDEHVRLYLDTGDVWHMRQAQNLREYALELKVWIHGQEGKTREE